MNNENKKSNQNKEDISPPSKKITIRQKLIKNKQIFNSSNKKKYQTISNIIGNYKMFKSNFISLSSLGNKIIEKNITVRQKQSHKNLSKNKKERKLREKESKSIDIKDNKNEICKSKFIPLENNNKEKPKNINNIININNISNSEYAINIINNKVKTPEHNKNKSKTKIPSRKINENQIKKELYTERDKNYEIKRLTKMNKFRNIILKNNEEINILKNSNKSHIKAIKRIPIINNYRDNMVQLKKMNINNYLPNNMKHILSYSSRAPNKNLYIYGRLNTNIHNKFKSMRLSNLYRNNFKNKNIYKIYLINNTKTNDKREIDNNAVINKDNNSKAETIQ